MKKLRLFPIASNLYEMAALRHEAAKKSRKPWKKNEPINGEYNKSLAVKCNNGTFVGFHEKECDCWLGVPFAASPVNDLRWKKPVPAETCNGVFEAFDYGPQAVQFSAIANMDRVPEGEDCLYLNIWRSGKVPANEKLPVMVWIHGGGFVFGSGTNSLYEGTNFLKDHPGFIYVTVEYRLGPLGFIALKSVPGGEKYDGSMNLGMLDQACALQWINKNIEFFGGDPENVTIFGESAGGASVSLLPVIKEARGTFRKVIVQSGNVGLVQSIENAVDNTRQFFSATGATCVEDLKKLSVEKIKEAYKQVDHMGFPARDGEVIPLNPFRAYEDGEIGNITMIMGTNAHEDQIILSALGNVKRAENSISRDFNSFLAANNIALEDWKIFRKIYELEFRPDLRCWQKLCQFRTDYFFRLPLLEQALALTKAGNKAFVYLWTQPAAGAPILGATHGSDLANIFNQNPDIKIPENKELLAETPEEKTVYLDPEFQKNVRNIWFNFAKIGNPDAKWPAYDEKSRKTMILGSKMKVVCDPLKEQREIFEPMRKYNWETSHTYGGLLDFWVNIHRKFF